MKLKGGSLKVKEIKAFLQASYEEDPPKEIMGYKLDEKLSFLYGKVYVNHKSKKVVVAHRGTVETIDWANNALYALNSDAYRLTPRYQQGLKMQNDAHKKYKGYQFETLGHSQGGLLAHLLSDKSKNGYLVNPAYKKEQLRDNEYVIRSSGDIVSKLSVPRKYLNALLYPSWSRNHYITIPAKTSNPITEHKPDILDRLDPERSIGRGAGFGKRPLKGYTINDEMSGGCYSDEMKGGARVSNPWVEHVKKYAKENNMTYACAIPEAKKTYIKVDKNAKKKEMMELLKKKWRSDINKNFTTVLRSNPESLPSLRLKFKTRNKGYREYMQQVAPKMYIMLTEKIGKKSQEVMEKEPVREMESKLRSLELQYGEETFSLKSRLPPSRRKASQLTLKAYNRLKDKLEKITNKKYTELQSFETMRDLSNKQVKEMEREDRLKYVFNPNDKIDMDKLYKNKSGLYKKKSGVMF